LRPLNKTECVKGEWCVNMGEMVYILL
jgi:hypothetical protein